MVEVSTSLLSVEKENIIKTIYNLETAKTDYFHIDVMDGKFVKNNTTEKMVEYCDYLSNITNIPLDVHLMVNDVHKYIDMFAPYNPNIISIHCEAINNKYDLIDELDYIKSNHCKAGIAISPNTDISKLYDIIDNVHVVLVMLVEPGEGGQQIIEKTIDKVKQLKEYINNKQLEVEIEVDGGINLNNVQNIKDSGAEIIVSGTGILESENYGETIKKMKE